MDYKPEYLSSKLKRGHRSADLKTLWHWCPACNTEHDFAVDQPFRNGARWSWDGNTERPTFSPSMNIQIGPYPSDPNDPRAKPRIDVCHYFLRNGVIQYLSDCTHAFAGQSIPLPDLPNRPQP